MNAFESRLHSKYSELVYNGFRFSPEREALQALVTETQRNVTGVVRLKLYKGNIIVAGRKSLLRSENRDNGTRHIAIRPKRCDRFHSVERAAIKTARSDAESEPVA